MGEGNICTLSSLNDPGLISFLFIWCAVVESKSFNTRGENHKWTHLAHHVKIIYIVQQERVQWATLVIGDIPPGGADKVSGRLGNRFIWDEGRPLNDHDDLESLLPLGGQARPLSPGVASGPVALLSI